MINYTRSEGEFVGFQNWFKHKSLSFVFHKGCSRRKEIKRNFHTINKLKHTRYASYP